MKMLDILEIWDIKLIKKEQKRIRELHFNPNQYKIKIDKKHGMIIFTKRYVPIKKKYFDKIKVIK